MMFIAVYEGGAGVGYTLEEALADLKDTHGGVDNDDVDFYEANSIDVEFKVVKKSQPVQVRK